MSVPGSRAVALVAIALVAPAASRAEGPALSLTVSGGVSLGAYQAGFLYYVLAAAQRNPGRTPPLKIATGASAGSVNSLLSLRYACGDLPEDPLASLFARTWLPVGYRELFRPKEVHALGVFSREALRSTASQVGEEIEAGLAAGCDLLLGIAVTRVTPRQRPLAKGRTTIPRTVEKFALRIEGLGPGRRPRITNFLEPDTSDEQPALPEGPDGTVSFEDVRDLLLASAAFPVAFAPKAVRHCNVVTLGRAPPFCPAGEATSADFIDGGVFDNDPLLLAARLASVGLEAGAAQTAPAACPGNERPLPPGVDFAFVSADAKSYPDPAGEPASKEPESLISLLLGEVGTFVETARAKELDTLLTEYPSVGEGLAYPQRHLPAASEPMAAFFGFFERDFREFDFALGMYEGRRYLVRYAIPRIEARSPGRALDLPGEGGRGASRPWRELACLRAVADGAGDPADRCAGEDLAQFRALLQTSLDRLWNDCRTAPPREVATYRACDPVLGGKPEPRVPGVARAARPRDDAESSTAYVVRLLSHYGFDWRDMGYGRASARDAMVGLHRDLARAGRALAQAQPSLASRTGVGAAADVGVDLFYYLPPSNAVWALFGRGLELGGGASVVDTAWLRLGGAVKLQSLYAALSSDSSPVSILPLAGVEFVPASLGSPIFQASFLARGGYLFRLGGGDSCSGEAGATIGGCSRPEVEGGGAVALAQLLRVQLVFEWYPPARGAPGLWAIVPSMGIQVGF